MTQPRAIIAGCGFVGETAARFLCRDGWQVLGLCASQDSALRLAGAPFSVMVCDIAAPLPELPEWKGADVVIHCASSGRGGADAYRAVYRDGMRHLLEAFQPQRAIFTGSTSVYAQSDGSTVDESSPTEPDRETGRVLLESEALALDAGGCVVRLSGIYGPGRSVLLRKYRDGSARLEAGGGRWINQIHRDDAASALCHVVRIGEHGGVYLASDDTPATQREVYGWIADVLGGELPPEGEPDMGRKRGWTNKRVSNARLRASGWAPRFPSYRHALPDLLAGL